LPRTSQVDTPKHTAGAKIEACLAHQACLPAPLPAGHRLDEEPGARRGVRPQLPRREGAAGAAAPGHLPLRHAQRGLRLRERPAEPAPAALPPSCSYLHGTPARYG
jgi:hypothetical protein